MTSERQARRAISEWAQEQFDKALAEERLSEGGQPDNARPLDGWRTMLGRNRLNAVLDLAADNPSIYGSAEEFDADPNILNTPGGIVDLTTGEVGPHDPAAMCMKTTKGSYRPGYTHPDWEMALSALPDDILLWWQDRVGQAITGHHSENDQIIFLQGGGDNAKSTMTNDGLIPALGDYAHVASAKLVAAAKSKGSGHTTEFAALRGVRLVLIEEMAEDQVLDVSAIKRIVGTSHITARHLFEREITFVASHTIFATTNTDPIVKETDWGTWRRLVLLRFPFRFVRPGLDIETNMDRRADPGLRQWLRDGRDGQHDAIVTWAVEGAIRTYRQGVSTTALPERVEKDTRAWRVSCDHVLGYWTERLTPDREACVLTSELFDDFNRWMAGNGHRELSRETFGRRFGPHTETARHGVVERRQLNPAGLVRHPLWSAGGPLTGQQRVWLGVRWQTDADQAEHP